jgi:hypothetical protein
MRFASSITWEEVELGFDCVEHLALGTIVTANLGGGLRAVKLLDDDVVGYAICDESFVVLYPAARSLAELRRRFGLGDNRKAG